MQEGLDGLYAEKLVNQILEYYPKELYVNLEEWIDEKPISDVKIHGVSIRDIMNQHIEWREEIFLDSCEAMLDFIKSQYTDKMICFDRFPRR